MATQAPPALEPATDLDLADRGFQPCADGVRGCCVLPTITFGSCGGDSHGTRRTGTRRSSPGVADGRVGVPRRSCGGDRASCGRSDDSQARDHRGRLPFVCVVGERHGEVLGLRTPSGQLGNGTTTDASTPVVVSGLTNAVAISAGDGHSCALLANGTAKCWGDNGRASWGTAPRPNASTPVVVSGLTNGDRDRGGRVPFVCVVGERDRQVLGRQQLRSVGERHDDQLVDAGRGERPDQRGRDLGGRRSFVCVVGERDRQVLGRQRLRAVGERHHDQLVDAGGGERPDQRGRDHGGRLRIRVRCWRTGPPNAGATTTTASWATAPRPARRRRWW